MWQVRFVFHFSYNDASSGHKARFIAITMGLCSFISGTFMVVASAVLWGAKIETVTNYFRPTTHLAVVTLCHINWLLQQRNYVLHSLERLHIHVKNKYKQCFLSSLRLEHWLSATTLELCTDSGKQCLQPLSSVYTVYFQLLAHALQIAYLNQTKWYTTDVHSEVSYEPWNRE